MDKMRFAHREYCVLGPGIILPWNVNVSACLDKLRWRSCVYVISETRPVEKPRGRKSIGKREFIHISLDGSEPVRSCTRCRDTNRPMDKPMFENKNDSVRKLSYAHTFIILVRNNTLLRYNVQQLYSTAGESLVVLENKKKKHTLLWP